MHQMVAPPQFASIVAQTTDYLRRMILQGELPQGERLIEAEIAEKLGVSRATIRESLRQLAVEGLVIVQARRGVMVSRLSDESAAELCICRALLEGQAARLAAVRATGADLAEMRRVVDWMHQASEAGERFELVQGDHAFHAIISRLAGNQLLADLSARLDSQMGALIIATTEKNASALRSAGQRHSAVVDALATGDPDIAQQAVHDHYLGTRNLTLR